MRSRSKKCGPPVNYATMTRFHENDSLLVKYTTPKVWAAARSVASELHKYVGGELKLRTLRAIVVGRRTI